MQQGMTLALLDAHLAVAVGVVCYSKAARCFCAVRHGWVPCFCKCQIHRDVWCGVCSVPPAWQGGGSETGREMNPLLTSAFCSGGAVCELQSASCCCNVGVGDASQIACMLRVDVPIGFFGSLDTCRCTQQNVSHMQAALPLSEASCR